MTYPSGKMATWLLLLAGAGLPALAEEPAAMVELKDLSLEQLFQIEVTSVSKKPEKLSSAAAAIYVITQEDIRRSGATSLPEILRLVPGLQVARFNSSSWAVNARGFNSTTANKLEVLMDGRSLYTPLFSGVFWDVQDTFLEDIERIEVIRGPGATLWGANAVNGVINIITRPAADTQGLVVDAGGGSEERAFGGARYGGKLGERGHFRAYAKAFDRDSLVLPNGADAANEWKMGQGGFRADWNAGSRDLWTLQGDIYSGTSGILGQPDTRVAGGNLVSRWSRKLGEASEASVQFVYDHTERRVAPQGDGKRDTVELQFQHRLQFARRHDIVWGAGYWASADHTKHIGNTDFDPPSRTTGLANVFLQDAIALVPNRWSLTVGSKFEQNDFTGFEVQPSVRLAWTPTKRSTWWSAISRAVRIPTRAEDDIVVTTPNPFIPVFVRGSRDFEAEEMIAYELGYRAQLNPQVGFDLAAFDNYYQRLRSLEPTPRGIGGFPLVISNLRAGRTQGVEAALNYQPVRRWRLAAAYTHLDVESHNVHGGHDTFQRTLEDNDPKHYASLRSRLSLPHEIEIDIQGRYVSAYAAPAVVPGYTEMDLRLGWRPGARWELSLVGQNLLHARHPEHGQPVVVNDAQRGFYVKLTGRF